MSHRCRILVADDALIVRRGLVSMLARAGHDVVSEVGDMPATLEAVHRLRPDVLLVDIRMPPSQTLEGLEIAQTVRRRYPHTAVLVLSQHVIPAYARRLLDESPAAVGYLLKDSVDDAAQLDDAVARVHDGGTVLDPKLVEHLLAHGPPSALETLSTAESAVLELLVEGLSNRGIAARRSIAPATVDSHVNAIFQKLDLAPDPDVNRRVCAVLAYLSAKR